ncbi:MAG: TonB-dependent receptor [Gammaproteobacteria bacterium]|nr:TonB-dependent receptor [Gammaproteobacteria bacterium]
MRNSWIEPFGTPLVILHPKQACRRSSPYSEIEPWSPVVYRPTLNACVSLAILALTPAIAHAHSAGAAVVSWQDGFSHPLHGWDHLAAMVAVGWWAARHPGSARWQIPLNFVVVMALGGLVGFSGAKLPGVEWVIAGSVVVFGLLAARAVRMLPAMSVATVSFFAFFHGFAHGQEMPGTGSLVLFGTGFMLATMLLHGAGFFTARVAALSIACLAVNAVADDSELVSMSAAGNNGDSDPSQVPEIVVTGRSDSQVGIATSASQGNVGAAELQYRPLVRPGELLETVPGLVVSQHSGEGKANQYYLRGFNLDHGTDFLTQVDGVPVNLATHAHGQGWTDTGFLIPELVRTISYQKGVYYAENGDFSSAGAANIQYVNELPASLASFEGGNLDFYRALYASSRPLGDGTLLYAMEGEYNDGPWQRGDHYRKANGVLRYSQESGESGWSATFMGYKADWDSTDRIAQRAVERGDIDRFGLIDPSDGGDSQRYSLTGEWHRRSSTSATKLMAYGYYYDLDLYSNFTYVLSDPVHGDQFEQPDQRAVSGFKFSHTFFHAFGAMSMETTFGLRNRNDVIKNGLFLTERRNRHATVREDDTLESSISPYVDNNTRWTDWLRTTAGVRFDAFRFDVASDRAANSGARWATIVSPKGGIVLGPWAATEVYLNAGLGFHSNDGRGVNTVVDPNTGTAVDRAVPLVRTYGAEVGARTTWLPGLQSTVALWGLDSDSELVFVGDAGTTEAGRPSRRYGVEFANYYAATEWLKLDADLSFSKSRFREHSIEGDHIPGSVETVIAAGATIHDLHGFFGSLRLRYFGPRPLIEDDSVRSKETLLISAQLGYQVNKTWKVVADVFNLLNRRDSAIDYYYASRLPGEAPGPDDGGYNDIHFHPVEPLSFRLGVRATF